MKVEEKRRRREVVWRGWRRRKRPTPPGTATMRTWWTPIRMETAANLLLKVCVHIPPPPLSPAMTTSLVFEGYLSEKLYGLL